MLHDKRYRIFAWRRVGLNQRFPRDELAVDTDRDVLLKRLKDFASMDIESARARFKLGKDARDWKVVTAQADVNRTHCDPDLIRPMSYRPFDPQWTYYTGRSRGIYASPCAEVLRHLTQEGAVGLSTCRNVEIEEFSHVFAIDGLIQHHSISSKEVNYAFPLYLYPEAGTAEAGKPKAYRVPNFSEDFLKKLAAALNTQRFLIKDYSTELSEMAGKDKLPPLPYDEKTGQYHGLPHKVSPEDIFQYIYAILHSPAYRERYKDFLKIDFPRIPLPKGRAVFEALIPLGQKLAALHLLDAEAAPELTENRHGFPISGDNTVDENFGTKKFPSYKEGLVSINQLQHFKDISPEVWSHTIGGYQPAEKWLKDRRGRTLTTDDLRHYQRMLIAIAETQKTMPQIDKVIESHGGFPGAFA
ncbi:MAG: type ISP restriction/modification enzyme [Luteolibacter sp.]